MDIAASEPAPAEIYDRKFVPALFKQWGPVVAGAAAIERGMSVLDVGCGTGALTFAAADAVGAAGEVIGLDANPDMLAVARAKAPDMDWRHGTAEALPFDANRFDAVVSQFAFMFFDDRAKALSEMVRVMTPGGTVAVAVCDDIGTSPGYSAFAALLDRLFGRDVGDAFRAPFVLGDRELLAAIARQAGIQDLSVERHNGSVEFASIEALVSTERACAWTLGGLLDDDQFDRLLNDALDALKPFADQSGQISFDMPALILTFRKH